MPITKSAKKALKQNIKRKARNIRKKKTVKSYTKKIKELVSQKKTEEAKKLLPLFYKAVDKAAKKGPLKKGAANRKKSRITKFINKAEKGA